ncbi:hypothetical protein C2857_004095 [Epichloe festucae Fl1]|uniref:Uncharacterized protein n=1 Tax=Epichloe festucae (strain Fl1) TaxID=877507 RepID=A0A7S9KKI1_EPIFF|nr:hypothetical protein C2857_004095 [Epichloe festucae Fl1]
MAQTFIHHGSHHSIPPDSPPGLLFLKAILPALDALGPSRGTPGLANLLAPDATFTINNGAPVDAADVVKMLGLRASRLSRFGHSLERAWDVDMGNGSRTVMYESTSATVFKEDAEGVEVRIKEFNVIELEPSHVGRGRGGLQAVKLTAYLDASPVSARAEAMQRQAHQSVS